MNTPKPTTPAHKANEQSASTRGQRRVNLLWEITQSVIAISVSLTTLAVAAHISTAESFILLSNAFFLVIGFYFGRTNHTRSGGVPDKHR